METKVVTLREALAETGVPEPGTGKRLEYIDVADIRPDPRNFYELGGIDELAANIELFGLQQPLVVRDDPTDPDKVILVSGHRRRAALEKLVEDGRADLRQAPCLREAEAGSEALQELRLIFANSGTRRMTSAEISRQAVRVEALLYALKEEGYDFPGRMRDHVAEACKVSKSKLARLKVIRENLNDWWLARWNEGKVAEETAYQVARLSPEHQQYATAAATKKNKLEWFYANDAERLGKTLAELEEKRPACPKEDGIPCSNLDQMKARLAEQGQWYGNHCAGKCCINCTWLDTCKSFCPHAKSEKDRIKREAKEATAKRKAEEAAREAPLIERKKLLWQRMAAARAAAGRTVEEVFASFGRYYSSPFEQSFLEAESGKSKMTGSSETPYGYMFGASDAIGLCAVADLLGVTLDYLLGRTDTDEPAPVVEMIESPAWQTGKPPAAGLYWVKADVEGQNIPQEARWADGVWSYPFTNNAMDFPVTGWWPLPEG